MEAPVRLQPFLLKGREYAPLQPDRLDRRITAALFADFVLQASAGDALPWLTISWRLSVNTVGHHFAVTRGTASDKEWRGVRQLPRHLYACTVSSGTFRGPAHEWLRRLESDFRNK